MNDNVNDFMFALSELYFGKDESESTYEKSNWDIEQYLNLGGFLQQKFINNFRKTHIDNLPGEPKTHVEQIIGGNDNVDEISDIEDSTVDEFYEGKYKIKFSRG